MKGTFRALKSRNYRLFFVGQTLSLIGTWMQSVAMSWLVYRLTGSQVLLGAVVFAQQIPMFIVSPLAGMFTDRVDRRRLLLLTQSLQAAQALFLAVLVLNGLHQIWPIIALSVFIGVVNAFDTPGRQAFVIEMVDRREDLQNAIALNSTQFNMARLIGPPLAGITVHVFGEGVCFLINAASFLAVIVSLLLISVEKPTTKVESAQPWSELYEGAKYVWHHGPIRALLVLMAIISFVSGSYQVLLPVYAKDVYHGNATTLGYLYGAVAVGALVSAIGLASRTSVLGLGRWIFIASSAFSVSLGLFGVSNSLWTGMAVLMLLGFGAMLHMGSTNTLIQTVVEDRMRGRVMAFYAMSFVGTMPIGSLVCGAVSERVGPTDTLLGSSLLGILTCYWFYRHLPLLRARLRPIYEDKGILPQRGNSG